MKFELRKYKVSKLDKVSKSNLIKNGSEQIVACKTRFVESVWPKVNEI